MKYSRVNPININDDNIYEDDNSDNGDGNYYNSIGNNTDKKYLNKKKNLFNKLLIVLSILVLCIGIFLLYYFFGHKNVPGNQVHISIKGFKEQNINFNNFNNPNISINILWINKYYNNPPVLSIAKNNSEEWNIIKGETKILNYEKEGVSNNNIRYVNSVTVNNINHSQLYKYILLNSSNINLTDNDIKMYNLYIPYNDTINLIVYGDLGYSNPVMLGEIINEMNTNKYTNIIHNGDIAYNLYSDNGNTGDNFLNIIEPIASKYPYMTSVGNHEGTTFEPYPYPYNFTDYRYRFKMPNYEESQNMYYYLDYPGKARLLIFSTEFYYFNYYVNSIDVQKQWLENILRTTDRNIFPFIITFGHRPMYCSNDDNDNCENSNNDQIRLSLEHLFNKYNVDFEIWAHEHSYERTCSLYNEKCSDNIPIIKKYNDYIKTIYNVNTSNPIYPIHIISGSTGSKEGHNYFGLVKKWSLFKNTKYSYGSLSFNKTHLNYKQKSNVNEIIDELEIIKN